jgi:flagellar basal body-associated protein FliL
MPSTQQIPTQQSPLSAPDQAYYFPGQTLGMPGAPPEAPPKRKRRTFLIVSLVLVALLVLCAGVGTTAYVVSKKQSGTGSVDPTTSVTGFLTAVYSNQDATAAAKFVCAQSNDAAQITSKVKELKAAASTYDEPTYSWTAPTVSNQTATEATVLTTVTMTTSDEKQSSENLTFTTVKSSGWWVCEVKSARQ